MNTITVSEPNSLPSLCEALSRLQHPGSEFRALPFWSWNAKLDPRELRRQIRIFRDMGFGGFFMHSREGLATEYLGKDWFDCVRACADEAKKCGMRAWGYDEDRWPSGAAGGLVTTSKRYRNRALVREVVKDDEGRADGTVVAWFAEVIAGDGAPCGGVPELSTYRRLHGPDSKLRRDETLVRYVVRVAPSNPRFNGGGYLDVISSAAVRKFVQTTHDAYARELKSDFGAAAAVPGLFTDEPQLQDPVPWTATLAGVFRRRFGYDILDRVPELFARVRDEDWSAVRYDYREIVAALFASAYSGTIGRWSARHGAVYTGHAMAEDTPLSQMDRMGSVMRFYEPMQLPGIDLLTEHWLPILTAKQCASVARQCGRPLRMCECYGCTGWDFPLEGHAAIGDWLLALGINIRVPHLSWYSMAGRVKRDYPASISYQSPWFRRYSAIESRAARAASLAGRGREERDLMLLHPAESHWGARIGWGTDAAHYNDHQRKGRTAAKPGFSGQAALAARDDAFIALVSDLASHHIDFDLGDESIMSRRGRVGAANGGKGCAAPALWIGKAAYRAVLIPSSLQTIRSSTLELLVRFAKTGGAVFAQGNAPDHVDGKPSKAAASAWKYFQSAPSDPVALDTALSPFARRLSLVQDGVECSAALVHERSWDDATVYFVHNVSAEPPRSSAESIGGAPRIAERTIEYPRAELVVPALLGTDFIVEEIDLESGRAHGAEFRQESGFLRIACPLPRICSRLFAVRRSSSKAAQRVRKETLPLVRIPRSALDYSLDEPNALVLDWAEWRLETEQTAKKTATSEKTGFNAFENILSIDRSVRLALGLQPRGDKPYQPWAVAAGMAPPVQTVKAALSLRFTFRVERGAAKIPCEIALERPDLWSLSLNGHTLSVPKKPAWWIDPCLKKVPLPASALHEGINTFEMHCNAFGASHQGLEAVYLLGAFAVVRGDRADCASIRPLPATLRQGDVSTQGLPNYGGNLTYKFRARVPKSGSVKLAPEDWSGTAIGFKVNGGKERFRPFPPYEATFGGGELRRDGTDEFEITVYGSRRNQLGPFYIAGGTRWPLWSGNGEMDCYAEAPHRALVPFGLGSRKK